MIDRWSEELFDPFSPYRSVWVIAMFDLPVKTKTDRRVYRLFHKLLLREGFTMLQYSVYARHCRSEETASWFRARLRGELPKKGQVRLLSVTDRQFGKMEVFFGEKREPAEEPPKQLHLF